MFTNGISLKCIIDTATRLDAEVTSRQHHRVMLSKDRTIAHVIIARGHDPM